VLIRKRGTDILKLKI